MQNDYGSDRCLVRPLNVIVVSATLTEHPGQSPPLYPKGSCWDCGPWRQENGKLL